LRNGEDEFLNKLVNIRVHVLLLTLWSRLHLFVWRTIKTMSQKFVFVWQSSKQFWSAQSATSHLTHLNTTSRPSLNTRGIGLLCQLICNMPPRRCPNPLRCFVFDSETAYELVSHAKPPLPFGKCAAQHNSNNTVSTNRNLESLRNT